jgi:MarR family 2-MHQ and catechol resistance regulon transcriptional repressor
MALNNHPDKSCKTRPPEETFRSLIRVIGLMQRVMLGHFGRFGISPSQWATLRNLHRAESEGLPGLRLTDLSERLLVRPPSITGVVARLERDGLVIRKASMTDQRAKVVRLTRKGRELVERIMAVHGEKIAEVLGVLSDDERNELHRLLGRLAGHLQDVVLPHVEKAKEKEPAVSSVSP